MQGLPWLHRACLWLGIAMDLGAKAGLCMQLRRFALKAHWAWFAFVLGFFALSSLANLGCARPAPLTPCAVSCQAGAPALITS